MKYRREVDGLRAFAVLPVVAFHAEMPGFSGGYIGVDVFFVISGFLITSILIHELNKGGFSLLNFYERRARRILPALFFMMFVSTIAGYRLMTPDQFVDFGQSIVAVILFASNVLFWLESDYFGPAAEEKPLLHTWSLAVEEQYYLFFPILLLLLWSFRKDFRITLLCLIAVVSLAFSQYAASNFPSANFYLLPSRVWELLVGSLCAFGVPFVFSEGMKRILAILGFCALIFSIFSFTSTTPFPSVFAVIPVFGTALILLFANGENGIGYFLQSRIFVAVGLVSYSFYLWHQPLFAFYRIEYGHQTTSLGFMYLSVLSFVFAIFSWRFVERPFRLQSLEGSSSRVKVFKRSGFFMLTFLVLGLLIYKSVITLPYELPVSVRASMERSNADENCFDNKDVSKQWPFCNIGAEDGPLNFAIIGDSHSLSVVESFSEFARIQGRRGLYLGYSGCPPLLGVIPFRRDTNRARCPENIPRFYNELAKKNVTDAILVARWSLYTGTQDAKAGDSGDIQFLGTQPGASQSLAANRVAIARALETTIQFARQNNIRLHIVQQVPQQPFNAKSIYYRVLSRAQDTEHLDAYSVQKDRYLLDNQPADDLFSKAQTDNLNVTYHKVESIFCGGQSCSIGTLNQSYYFDDDHLSLFGAQKLQPVWEQILAP